MSPFGQLRAVSFGLNNMAFDVLTKKPTSIAQAIDMIEWYECCKSNKENNHIQQLTLSNDDLATEDTPTADIEIR